MTYLYTVTFTKLGRGSLKEPLSFVMPTTVPPGADVEFLLENRAIHHAKRHLASKGIDAVADSNTRTIKIVVGGYRIVGEATWTMEEKQDG